jgi:hypothetical protein
MAKFIGFVVIFAALSTVLMADFVSTPEIDAATGSSALALIAGALLVIRGRRSR